MWLRDRYAKYWYGVGCVVLDVVLIGYILHFDASPTQPWQYALAVVALIALAYVEVKGFERLWPREDPA